MRSLLICVCLLFAAVAVAQEVDPRRGPLGCIPVAKRATEVGCYVVGSISLGEVKEVAFYWHLDLYPTRPEAERARSRTGMVLEAFEKIWLLTIAAHDWRPSGGTRVTSVGPLTVRPGLSYTASFLEAVMFPGAESSVHHHPGPEALIPLTGEECMETPLGKQTSAPTQKAIIVPGYMPHRLTITGKDKRTSLGVIVHESSEPLTFNGHDYGWKPKGLCHVE